MKQVAQLPQRDRASP